MDRISLGGPVFDLKKLLRFNGIYIRKLSTSELRHRLIESSIKRQMARMNDVPYFEKVASLFQERLKLLSDFDMAAHFLFTGALAYNIRELVPKGKNLNQTKSALFAAMEAFRPVTDWTTAALEQKNRDFCEEIKWSTNDFFMFLRIIITGSTQSPPLFETMEVLGKEECIARLQDGLAALQLS